jgi:hypothetical protein
MLTSSVQVPLSGMGFDFFASITDGSSQTVSSGLTARYTLALSPANGSSGTFAFSCGTLPAHAACSFNPVSETVAANTTGSLTMQIATGQASAIVQPAQFSAWKMFPMACGLLMLPLDWRSRRKGFLLFALLAFIALSATSCSRGDGGGSAPPPASTNNNTPAGTYSIDVTATADGVFHKVTVSLIVDWDFVFILFRLYSESSESDVGVGAWKSEMLSSRTSTRSPRSITKSSRTRPPSKTTSLQRS